MNTEGDLTNLISTAQQPQPQQPPQQPQQRQQQQSVQQDETTDSTSTGLPPEHISSTTAPPSSPPKDVTAVSASCTRQYAMLRASKKFRPPISIFDLPCQPASAPPQDTESFFAHLDTVEKTLEEEDAGQIPKALETGPQIVVESLNKKRRRVPTTSEQPLEISTEIIPEPPPAEALDDKLTPQGFLSNPLPFSQSSSSSASMGITSESPSISSSSSGSLSFTGDTAATTTTDDMNDSMPKDKKVRFSQDPAEIHLIKNWRRRASKRKERHFIRHSAIVKHPNALQGISTTDTSDTNTMPPRGRILSADLPSYEDQQFHEWLAGTSPPPPMPEPVTQQMSGIVAENSQKPSTKKKRFSERLRGPLKTQQEEPLPVEAKGSSSMIDGHESEQISMSKQLASDQDQSQDPNEDTVELEFVPETQEEASMDPEGTSKEIASEKNTSTSIPQTNTIITRIPGPSMPTIFNTKKHNDILDKGDESASATTLKPNNMTVDAIGELIQVDSDLEEKSVNLDGIIENTSSSTNTALDLQAITASSKGKAKKDKEPVKTVAAMIRPRRKLVAPSKSSHIVEPQSEKPSSNMSSDVAAGKKHAPLARTISLISIEDDDDDTKVADIDKAPTPPMPQTNMASKPGSTARQTQASVKKGKKPATTESPALPSSSKAKTIALSELSLYVIPNNMDTAIFNITRKRVIELHGKWLGPAFKVLSTDPRAKAEIPPLDQENTTHIVTAFTSVEEVKRFFNVTTINPKIAIVNRDWLSDSIMFKRPMEAQGYALRKTYALPSGSKIPSQDETPPHTQHWEERIEGSSTKNDNKRLGEFESTENSHDNVFKEIMQGIQEGSLDDAELSDGQDNNGDATERNDVAQEAIPELTKPKSKVSEEKLPYGLTPEVTQQLTKENRCFNCKEVGHSVDRCPHRNPGTTKDDVLLQIISSGKSEGKKRKAMYQCQSPHVAGKKDEPRYNKAILEQLKILMGYYEDNQTKDNKYHFKVINYRKAITAIRALDYEITSEEMARKIPRVGKKIAQKIGECVSLGRIKKLDHLDWDQERLKVETLFRSVYGVGAEKALEWYNKGLRTLDDLRKLPDLTKNQISGLHYYDDLQKRIPRAEVEEIGKVVESAAKKLHPDIQSQVTGSYRRGKPDCGDIDIVVARPDIDTGEELFLIMEHILNELIIQGFLVDHLSLPTWSDDMANAPKHFKYMGICKLPGKGSVHRHIDILVVPWIHLGAALLYFTGNDICNRSMRLLAANRGMRLSDKGLFTGVMRGPKRKRLNEGTWVAGRTEREIFDYLGINYLEPFEREC